jgi:mevalonate kinase
MWIGLLWIVGCYGAAVALLHMLIGARRGKESRTARVLLITQNNASHIEWYIRSLFFFSRVKGRELAVTVLDEGSMDDTVRIIERLSHSHKLDVELGVSEQSLDQYLQALQEENVMVVNISNRDEMISVPVF